jgi:integrase
MSARDCARKGNGPERCLQHRARPGQSSKEVLNMVTRNSIIGAVRAPRAKKRDRVWERRNKDGSTSYIAVVRIEPFDSTSKSFPSLAEARRWADELARELTTKREQTVAQTNLTSLTIKGLIEEYLADPETKKLRTYADVERLLAWWINHCGADKALQFGTVKLREARALLNRGRASGTTNRYLGALRSCWNWGRAAGFISTEKTWPTRLFLSEPRERVRFLNDAELAALVAAAGKHALWIHTAIIVSLASGLRQGELLRLKWDDIDLDGQTLTVHISKSGKRRIVHLAAPAIEALKTLRRNGIIGRKLVFVRPNGEPADKSFLTFHWNEVRAAAGLVDFKWHDLRHSCASFLAQGGASLPEIGHVLGHSSPTITAKYAHFRAGKPVTGSEALAAKLAGKL